MSRAAFECNIEDTFNAFMDLTSSEMNKAVKRALRAGAKELVKQTKANATSSMKTRNNTQWYDGKIIVFNDKIEDAVMISKMDGDFDNELSQKVHIMGTRKSGSGTYRLRFLEKGTKKGRGPKRPKWFFKDAQNQVFPNLPNIYAAEIQKTIDKLNTTKL